MRVQVPGKGPRDAPIILCGEQPGKYEVIKRQPFIGPAGRELDKCMQDASIPRLSCYLTNTIKSLDYPIGEYFIAPRSKRPPAFTHRADEHLDYLRQELIEMPHSNVICAVGNIALFALTNRYGISKWRGSVLDSTLVPGRKVVPLIHPSTILYGQFLNRYLIIKDLITAREESAYPDIRKIPRYIQIAPTFHETIERLQWLINLGRGGHILDFDIEVLTQKDLPGGEMVCLAFAWDAQHAICIPLQGPGGDYFPPDQEAKVLLKVAELLEDEAIPIRGQGICFDCAFMLARYGIRVRGELHDTMIAQKILLPDFRVGLDFITREYTDINYYKDEGKKWFAIGGPWQQFWTYNGMDTISTAAAHPSQIDALNRQGNIDTYERQRKLIKPLVYMMTHGTLVDIEGMRLHRARIEVEQAQLRQRLDELAGRPLPETFATSPKQVAEYFYIEKGIKPYMKKGSVSTDVTAMKRLKRRGFEEADIISRLRYLKSKALGTYLDLDKISPDGRYRCYWNPVGAETGRISSSEDIFGQGTNLMNWPHELLSYLVADPGFCFYAIDLGQAENRIVAYTGSVLEMIRCFEEGIDVHSLVGASIASLITGEQFDWQEIKRLDKAGETCDIGDGTKSWRYYGKRTGHACVDAMTQVLTRTGWRSISLLAEGDEIMQWDPQTEKLSWDVPTVLTSSKYKGEMISLEGTSCSLLMTPNHRMYMQTGDSTNREMTAEEVFNRSTCYMPLTGFYNQGIIGPNKASVEFLAAVICDGSVETSNKIAFNLKKERKIIRLLDICSRLGIIANLDARENESGVVRIRVKCDLVRDIVTLVGKERSLGPWLFELRCDELKCLVEEVMKWDGYESKDGRNRRAFFTTNENNAIWIQTAAHLAGMQALLRHSDDSRDPNRKRLYTVSINSRRRAAMHSCAKKKELFEGMVFCPTVSTGAFLIRRNGNMMVTGNSNYDMGVKTFSLQIEVPESEAAVLFQGYHRLFPEVRGNYQELVKAMLLDGRTITNLFGRKRIFLDQWGDELFKAAYAQIPQSTVADKINEHGLFPIYYEEQFRPIELLNQIHDAVGFQIPISIGFTRHAEMLIALKRSLEQPLTWQDRSFSIPADLTQSLTWNKDDGVEYKGSEFIEDPVALGRKLEENYNKMFEQRQKMLEERSLR